MATIKAKLEKLQPNDEDRAMFLLSYRSEDDENNVYLSIISDGAWEFTNDGDGFIYLYPQQVKHLKSILRPKHKQMGS